MLERLTTIRLYGKVGSKFGRVHRFVANTPKDAISALCHMIPGFRHYVMESRKHGVAYAIFRGKKNISMDEVATNRDNTDIRIAPMILGSKQAGVFQLIAAAVVAAFMWWNPLGWSAAAVTAGYASAASMAIGGVVQMLTPQTLGLTDTSSADNKPSYAFGGVTNTTAQGYPVPVLYGKRRIGGAIISAGIYVEDQQ